MRDISSSFAIALSNLGWFLNRGLWVQPLSLIRVTRNDSYLVGIVGCQVGIDEDKEVCDGS